MSTPLTNTSDPSSRTSCKRYSRLHTSQVSFTSLDLLSHSTASNMDGCIRGPCLEPTAPSRVADVSEEMLGSQTRGGAAAAAAAAEELGPMGGGTEGNFTNSAPVFDAPTDDFDNDISV